MINSKGLKVVLRTKLNVMTDESTKTRIVFIYTEERERRRRQTETSPFSLITIPGHPDDLYDQLLLFYHLSKSLTIHAQMMVMLKGIAKVQHWSKK